MNKKINLVYQSIKKPTISLWILFDKKIIIPITKAVLYVSDLLKDNRRRIEYVLSQKNSLIFISLILSLVLFFVVDTKANLFIESSAEILYNQRVNAIYNEEAYVIEGLPETVDVTLIGSRSSLYLAKQLPVHEITVDLSGLRPGTHRVNIRYKQPLTSIDYKLDPSFTTVVIHQKVSVVRDLSTDLLHKDKLDPKLYIEKIETTKSEVIVKGAQHRLNEVAAIKALIDIQKLTDKNIGNTVLNDIPLIAYDVTGNKLDVEIVPSKINATLTIASPNKIVPIKVVPIGNVSFGKAIETISLDKSRLTIYGDESTLANINYIPVEIDVTGLRENRDFNIAIRRPSGIRYISVNNVRVNLTLDDEINKEISGIRVEHKNLANNLTAQAASAEDAQISVILKGAESVLNDFDINSIYAYVDLSGYGVGQHEVDVVVYGDDPRIVYLSKTKRIKIRIIN